MTSPHSATDAAQGHPPARCRPWADFRSARDRIVPGVFFGGLMGWATALLLTALAHADLPLWGRDRHLLSISSGVFGLTTLGGWVWAVLCARRLFWPMFFAGLLWLGVILGGGRDFFLGLTGPPSIDVIRMTAVRNGYPEEWIEKSLHGPAVSAASDYMVDVYLWELLSEVRVPFSFQESPKP